MQEDEKQNKHAKIEDLNKTQVLLLVLFVAFVTSIASSIVTVTLLDQAPPAITQTINRIVERTVEVAVPGKPVIERVREVPVIVTEEDLIADAVKGATPALVYVTDVETAIIPNASSSTTTPIRTSDVLALGFIVSKDGLVVSGGTDVLPGQSYNLKSLVGQREWKATALKSELPSGYVLLKITNAQKDEILPYLSFETGAPTPGKTALSVGSSRNFASVLVGTISSYSETPSVRLSTTLLVRKDNVGAPILDTKGRVIGIVDDGGESLPVDPILSYLERASDLAASSTASTVDKKQSQ